jgi:cell wall-associated NlpC family hydrolase
MSPRRAIFALVLLLAVTGCAKQVLSPDLSETTSATAGSATAGSATAESASSRNATAARMATRYLGAPYVWAGAGPAGFDCSGLVMYAFGQVGVAIPHNAAQQFRLGTPVDRDRLVPGDVVFFNQLRHNGIYLGGGRFVHSTKPGGVRIARLDDDWFRTRWVGARRLYNRFAA